MHDSFKEILTQLWWFAVKGYLNTLCNGDENTRTHPDSKGLTSMQTLNLKPAAHFQVSASRFSPGWAGMGLGGRVGFKVSGLLWS